MSGARALATVLLVDDDPLVLESLGDYLDDKGYRTLRYADAGRLAADLPGLQVDAAFLDLRLSGASGLDLLPRLRDELDVPVIILTGHGDVASAVAAMRLGAYEFQTKPVRPEALVALLRNALEHRALARENRELRRAADPCSCGHDLVAVSPGMRRVRELLGQVAGTDCSVLVRGETGTGKELVSRALHRASRRARGPFLAVNCAALNPSLFESTLFGHERGSFTGAQAAYRGDLEQAEGGTLFLDEVGSMPLEIQGKLLRVLEDRTFRRLGSEAQRRADVRFVAATNADLEAEVERGSFRRDLYYRLAAFTLTLPPLRDRPEDVPHLAMHFLLACAPTLNKRLTGFTERALRTLQAQPWPGNVRQLRHAVEQAAILATGEQVDAFLGLDAGPPPSAPAHAPALAASDATFEAARAAHLAAFESDYLARLLARYAGNLTAVSRASGIPYRTLHRKVREVGLDRTAFVPSPPAGQDRRD